MKTNYPKKHTMTLNGMKIKRSKKVKSLLEQIGLGELWMKAYYADIGIVNMIRQRLKDIELQRWLSKINNDTKQQNENLPVIQNDRQLQM